jgi:hypothetical protein
MEQLENIIKGTSGDLQRAGDNLTGLGSILATMGSRFDNLTKLISSLQVDSEEIDRLKLIIEEKNRDILSLEGKIKEKEDELTSFHKVSMYNKLSRQVEELKTENDLLKKGMFKRAENHLLSKTVEEKDGSSPPKVSDGSSPPKVSDGSSPPKVSDGSSPPKVSDGDKKQNTETVVELVEEDKVEEINKPQEEQEPEVVPEEETKEEQEEEQEEEVEEELTEVVYKNKTYLTDGDYLYLSDSDEAVGYKTKKGWKLYKKKK